MLETELRSSTIRDCCMGRRVLDSGFYLVAYLLTSRSGANEDERLFRVVANSDFKFRVVSFLTVANFVVLFKVSLTGDLVGDLVGDLLRDFVTVF